MALLDIAFAVGSITRFGERRGGVDASALASMVGSKAMLAANRCKSAAFDWARRTAAAAVYLALAGGCAQIAGIEPWKPLDCSLEENAARDECKPQASPLAVCSQCMRDQASKCTAARDGCTADMPCADLLKCTDTCSATAALFSCAQDCCGSMTSNDLFDSYITCLCGGCGSACDGVMPVCANVCDPPASASEMGAGDI